MVTNDSERPGGEYSGISEPNSRVEAVRNKIKFARASAADTDNAFRSESKPRRQRTIPKEKRSQVTISDTRPEVSDKVKGRPPKELKDEVESEPVKRGRPRKLRPTIEDSQNTAKFLLSAIEIACITSVGPTGEMTDWERGLMQAPLQRIIQRTPINVIEKGGMLIDCGFLIIGSGIYFSRVLKGVKLPQLSNKKRGEETVTDTAAPVAARANEIVDTIKPGDVDGLAQPVPTVITNFMNGAI